MYLAPAPELDLLLPALRAARRAVHREQWRSARAARGVALAAVLRIVTRQVGGRRLRRASTSSGWGIVEQTNDGERDVARIMFVRRARQLDDLEQPLVLELLAGAFDAGTIARLERHAQVVVREHLELP